MVDPLQQPLVDGTQGPGAAAIILRPVAKYFAVTMVVAAMASWACFEQHFGTAQQSSFHYTLPYMALAVTAAILASANALHHMLQHIRFNKNTWELKTTALVILSMVPVYALCSAIALVTNMSSTNVAVVLNSFREFYEAMVLIAFLQFIAEFWGGTKRLARLMVTDDLSFKTVFPTLQQKVDGLLERLGTRLRIADLSVFYIFRRAPGSEYVAYTFVGALVYALVMIAFVVVTIYCRAQVAHDKMAEEHMDKMLQRLKIVKFPFNVWAMWNLLVLFEYLRECRNTEHRMNMIRPISKFVCIKLIVLFSLWQEGIMTVLAKFDLLPELVGWKVEWKNEKKTAEGAVNFLVCLEMLLFAQWHRYAYPYEENWAHDWEPVAVHQPRLPCLRCGFPKMLDDVLYLTCNRVNRQHKCVKLLAKVKRDPAAHDVGPESELRKLFGYFDLNDEEEVSVAQLRFILYKSGFARSMEDAKKKVAAADIDSNGSLSYQEFLDRLILHDH